MQDTNTKMTFIFISSLISKMHLLIKIFLFGVIMITHMENIYNSQKHEHLANEIIKMVVIALYLYFC